jgi:cyclohexa-1,5-dienecarbonyl-CoA hydratase
MNVIATPAATHLRARLDEDGTLLRLVLDKPKGNVLDAALLGELHDALRTHRDDPHLRLVAIQGAGGHFSFGASVEEHRAAQAPSMLRSFHALVRELAMFPVPVAALVEGRCLGGAFEVALCCSFVLAAPGAVFACPEIKLGVFPPVLAVLGPGRLGAALTERLMLTGQDLTVDEARATGFVTTILESDTEAAFLAWYREKVRPLSAFSLRQARRAFLAGASVRHQLGPVLDAVEAQYVAELVPSHDGNEGVEAFLARRKPEWRDA